MVKVDDALDNCQSQPGGITFFVVGLIETSEKARLIQRGTIRAVGESDSG